MKGIEPATTTLVVIVLGATVLVSYLATFSGVWPSQTQGTTLENAKNSACNALLSANCFPSTADIPVRDFDADKDGSINDPDGSDNLLALCQNYYGVTTEEECKTKVCKCSGAPSGGGGGAPPAVTQCNDGIDNDGDGLVDMDDSGCSDLSDDSECGLEGESCAFDNCCSGLDCVGNICTSCSCEDWQDVGCGLGACPPNQMYQTRICNPAGCDVEEQCVDDPSCTGALTGAMIEYKINPGVGTNNFIAMSCYNYSKHSWTKNLVFRGNEDRITHENVTIPQSCLNGPVLMTSWAFKKDVTNRPRFYEEKLWRLQGSAYVEDDTEDSYLWTTGNVINPGNAVDENWNSYSEYDEGFAILQSLYINYTLTPTGCNDPDESDKTTKGTCFDSSGSHEDYCINETHICEFVCSGALCECSEEACPSGSTCINGACVGNTYQLKVEVKIDRLNLPLPNVNVVVDDISKSTDSNGIATFSLTYGEHQLSVPSKISSRSFSHFWDQDCDENNLGFYLDTPSNPYSFTMYERERTIVAFYKVLTNIELNYNSSTIFGKLLDESSNPLIAGPGNYHPVCEDSSILNPVDVDRDVLLEYYDGSWHNISYVTTSITDGSFSYPFTLPSGTSRIRASYSPTNWYYEKSSKEILTGDCTITGGFCTPTLSGCRSICLGSGFSSFVCEPGYSECGSYCCCFCLSNFDFSINLNPTSGAVTAGSSIPVTINLTLLSGTSQPVTLSASNLPPNTTVSFDPSGCSPNCESTMWIFTGVSTPAGNYTITVSATDGTITRSANFDLAVYPPETCLCDWENIACNCLFGGVYYWRQEYTCFPSGCNPNDGQLRCSWDRCSGASPR
ncbi:MAG: hypothetical protein ACTSYD_10125 [Candidatus Heimdallarchaeaceae archaeon]